MSFFSNVLGMKLMSAKFVQKLLNFVQIEQRRMESLNELNVESDLLKWFVPHGFIDVTSKLRLDRPSRAT